MEEFILLSIKYTLLMWVVINMTHTLLSKYQPELLKYYCPKCWSFWLTLIITLNPFLAAAVAFNNYLIDKYLTDTKTLL